MEGCFTFQWRGVVFQMGDFIFKSGGISLDGRGVLKKIIRWEGCPLPIPPSTMGNPTFLQQGLSLQPNFHKRGGLTGPQLLERDF